MHLFLLSSVIVSFVFSLTGGQPEVEIHGSAVFKDFSNYVITAYPMEIHSVGDVTYIIDNLEKEVYVQNRAEVDNMHMPDLLGGRRHLEGTYTEPSSGQKYKYVLDDITRREDDGDVSSFDPDSLPEGWIVTDLR